MQPSVESSLAERWGAIRTTVERFDQAHLLRFWDELDSHHQATLLEGLEAIPFELCARLIPQIVRQRGAAKLPALLTPLEARPSREDVFDRRVGGSTLRQEYEAAMAEGVRLIRDGRVAAFTVAGGQGTRLGFDGPKGAFPISPLRKAPLFQWFAEGLRGIARKFGFLPRWYIMTSPQNDAETRTFFSSAGNFGLPEDRVRFFSQGQMPAFLPDGRIAMAGRGEIALSPNGHGGSLAALSDSGALAEMQRDGVTTISYFQVDNPLVRVIDPLFIGLHVLSGSEMASKAVRKAHDKERVGVFCRADGKPGVIEYSDMPEEISASRNAEGGRVFDAGSIAVHLLDRAFVQRLCPGPGGAAELPWHRAEKAAAVLDDRGNLIESKTPNVVKLERFIFDALEFAANPLVLYTDRAEEFSPVKNAQGDDSPATSIRDIARRGARWLQQAGFDLGDRLARAEPWPIEISPAFAVDATDLAERLRGAPLPAGSAILLADDASTGRR